MARPKPAISADTSFFWDGAARHELLIQRCTDCKTLRHPPGPGCANCSSLEWDTVEASGKGSVHSFAVHHYPPVPGFDYPVLVGLIDLDEGVRMISNVTDIEPSDVEIGMRVEVHFSDFDGLVLPQWRPAR